jgi:hypothetical protein
MDKASRVCLALMLLFVIFAIMLCVDFLVRPDKYPFYNQPVPANCDTRLDWLKQQESEDGTMLVASVHLPCTHQHVTHRVAVHAVNGDFVAQVDIKSGQLIELSNLEHSTTYCFHYMQTLHKDCAPICQFDDVHWTTTP